MYNIDKNISNKLNRLRKRPKCQSCCNRYKKPIQKSFQFKSSLFTEKNRSLIEKLISQSASPENSFSKDNINQKEINKTEKSSKANNSIINSHHFCQNIDNYKRKIFHKKMLNNKINSTFSCMNNKTNNINNSLKNCQINPIKKNNNKIKLCNNNSLDKRKIVFIGMKKNDKNNSVKTKLSVNLNGSSKCLYERKKLNGSVKIGKISNKRNYENNKNSINIITVNTINLKNRKNNNNNMKLIQNKPKLIQNQRYRNTIHNH